MWLALAACTTRPSFDRTFVRVYCDRASECRPDGVSLFSPAECRSILLPEQEGVSACLADRCAFDGPAARACLDAVREGTCADFVAGGWIEPCGAVWTECGPTADACRGVPVGTP